MQSGPPDNAVTYKLVVVGEGNENKMISFSMKFYSRWGRKICLDDSSKFNENILIG